MITESIPNTCFPVAAVAAKYLALHGIPCKLFRIKFKRGGYHMTTVFEYGKRLRCYDDRGTTDIAKKLGFKSEPLAIAKSICEQKNYCKPKTGKWVS